MFTIPKSFTTVTPLSKLLALVLFVMLPFAGFYLGYQYGKTSVTGSTVGQTVPVVATSSSTAVSTTSVPTRPTTTTTTKTPVKTGSTNMGNKSPIVTKPTVPAAPSTPACYVNNCHGMAITCSPQPTDLMCTAEYQLGDFCRQYEHCVALNNSCQIVQDTKYGRCTNCVQSCVTAYPDDQQKVFACESQCRTELSSS